MTWKKGDYVQVGNQFGFITGIAIGEVGVRDIHGKAITKITKGGKETNQLSYKQLTFKHRNSRWLYSTNRTTKENEGERR